MKKVPSQRPFYLGSCILAQIAIFLLILSLPANAFVPSAKYLLERLAAKRPSRIDSYSITQNLTVHKKEKVRSGKEIFYLKKPDRYCVLQEAGEIKTTHAVTGQKSTLVVNNRVVAVNIDLNIIYRLFKFTGSSSGLALLQDLGVDTSKVSLGRLDGKIVYIIGAASGKDGPEKPQAWLSKANFHLLRFYSKDTFEGRPSVVDLRFSNYPGGKESATWFPRKIEVLYDGTVKAQYAFLSYVKNPQAPPYLFDYAILQKNYPADLTSWKGGLSNLDYLIEQLNQ